MYHLVNVVFNPLMRECEELVKALHEQQKGVKPKRNALISHVIDWLNVVAQDETPDVMLYTKLANYADASNTPDVLRTQANFPDTEIFGEIDKIGAWVENAVGKGGIKNLKRKEDYNFKMLYMFALVTYVQREIKPTAAQAPELYKIVGG